MKTVFRGFFSAALFLATVCGRDLSQGMALSSSAFQPHAAIPKRHTCDGGDSSPPPPTKERFEASIKTHGLARAELVGTYQR